MKSFGGRAFQEVETGSSKAQELGGHSAVTQKHQGLIVVGTGGRGRCLTIGGWCEGGQSRKASLRVRLEGNSGAQRRTR